MVLSEQSVTIVLCNDVAEVEALYSAHLVDAEVVPHGGSTDYINPDEVRRSHVSEPRPLRKFFNERCPNNVHQITAGLFFCSFEGTSFIVEV